MNIRKILPVLCIVALTTPVYSQSITGGGSSGGTPGGSDTQVQYNDSGTLGGITGATTNGTVLTLTSPVLVTPDLGTPTTLVGTNITGTAAGLSVGGSSATSTTTTNIAGGAAGQLPRQTGAGTTGFTTATYPATAGTSGNVLTSDGTNFVSSAPASVNFPTLIVSKSGGQNLTSGGGPEVITWGTPDVANGISFATDVATVGSNGYYRADVSFDVTATTITSLYCELRKNGSSVKRLIGLTSLYSSAEVAVSNWWAGSMAATDTFDVRCEVTGTGTITVQGGDPQNTQFMVQRVYN